MSTSHSKVVPFTAEALPTLRAMVPVALNADASTVSLRHGQRTIEAELDPSVSPVVVEGAIARQERVVAQQEGGALVVIGALRTAPTPGQDVGDDYVIEARRVMLRGHHKVSLASGESSFVLRAIGRVELLSRNISSRARGVQKLIARVIELN